MTDEKALLRRLVRLRRREFVAEAGPATCAIHALAIAHILFERARDARSLALYLSNGSEIDPRPVAEIAWAEGKAVALPSFETRGNTMRFAAWLPGMPLVRGPYGIAQPPAKAETIAPEIIVAPLVAFDRTGARLGQGGGHYDRAFAAFPDARRIGLAWSVQEIAHVPVESWDKPLHAVATEKEWIDCA